MSKQTLIDELTEELNQAKSTYQECNSNLSKRIFETKIRAYSHALDLANYHIHDEKDVLDINQIEKQIMNVVNDFVAFVKPSREVNAFVFDMLKQKIILALQEYNLNGGWISVDNPPKEFETVLLFGKKYNGEPVITDGHLIQCLVDEFGINDGFSIPIFITHWQPRPNPPKE